MMISKVESFVQCIPELHVLFEKNWAETQTPAENVLRPLKVNYKLYAEMELAGVLLFITLRDYGTLVGYLLAHVYQDINSMNCLAAQEIAVFVEESARGGLGSRRMVRLAERVLAKSGVRRFMVASLKNVPTDRLWKALGYAELETVYVKWLATPAGARETVQ